MWWMLSFDTFGNTSGVRFDPDPRKVTVAPPGIGTALFCSEVVAGLQAARARRVVQRPENLGMVAPDSLGENGPRLSPG